MSDIKTKERPVVRDEKLPRCTDYDEDCEDVRCKLSCWLHAPELGLCPYLYKDT